jgi:hypothetical protein
VPDLQLHSLAGGHVDQGVGFLEGDRQRLFHQHRHAGLERAKPYLGVGRRDDRDRHRFHATEQVIEIVEGAGPDFGRDRGGPTLVEIVDADQRHP